MPCKLNVSRTLAIAILSTAALATACSRQPPDQLPPAPGSAAGLDESEGIRPGSRAHFLAEAGTDTVLFDTNMHELDGEARAILEAQARWLVSNPSVTVTVEGHCDERGTREYNVALGERRANAAKNYLAGLGVDPRRMTTISYGKERPVAMGSDPASWALNRRSVTVVPN